MKVLSPSHFYLALYWAEALARQDRDAGLKARFAGVARQLEDNEATIIAGLNGAQGRPVDLWGYYHPNADRANEAMRPSMTFNEILSGIG